MPTMLMVEIRCACTIAGNETPCYRCNGNGVVKTVVSERQLSQMKDPPLSVLGIAVGKTFPRRRIQKPARKAAP